jgi:gamma-glutamyl-gamma-aminobutyrate hydrolase PuuD
MAMKKGELNELGPPGVPDVTDVFMGLPPAINGKAGAEGLNGGQEMLKLVDQPQPVVDLLGRVIKQPSHQGLAPPGKRKITIIEDNQRDFPCLCLSVYVEGDLHEQKAFASMFVRALCKRAETPDDADLVVFTGGTDVNPELYGHKRHGLTDDPDLNRDEREMLLFQECKEKGIPMLGVCRGAQFLHVMHGGKLYQDVDNHNRPHAMITVPEGIILPHVSSVHHQMIVPDSSLGIRVLATSSNATNRLMWEKDNTYSNSTGRKADVEAFFYRDTCTLGFQGHPEYSGYPEYTEWCMQMVEDWITSNPDCDWAPDRHYRLKEEFRNERDKMEKSIMAQTKKKKNKQVLTVPKVGAKSAKEESK